MRSIKLNVKFWVGDSVYVVHDPEQKKWFIDAVTVNPTGLRYSLTSGNDGLYVYEVELSAEKDMLIKCGVKVDSTNN